MPLNRAPLSPVPFAQPHTAVDATQPRSGPELMKRRTLFCAGGDPLIFGCVLLQHRQPASPRNSRAWGQSRSESRFAHEQHCRGPERFAPVPAADLAESHEGFATRFSWLTAMPLQAYSRRLRR